MHDLWVCSMEGLAIDDLWVGSVEDIATDDLWVGTLRLCVKSPVLEPAIEDRINVWSCFLSSFARERCVAGATTL